jgi:hypothetical protein
VIFLCLSYQLVEGDYTATVHVEEGMWLNIDFKDSAMLSFSVAVYPVCFLYVM